MMHWYEFILFSPLPESSAGLPLAVSCHTPAEAITLDRCRRDGIKRAWRLVVPAAKASIRKTPAGCRVAVCPRRATRHRWRLFYQPNCMALGASGNGIIAPVTSVAAVVAVAIPGSSDSDGGGNGGGGGCGGD